MSKHMQPAQILYEEGRSGVWNIQQIPINQQRIEREVNYIGS